jgi:hypothetical protein
VIGSRLILFAINTLTFDCDYVAFLPPHSVIPSMTWRRNLACLQGFFTNQWLSGLFVPELEKL